MPMLPAAAQQPPPLQLLRAHDEVWQQPPEGMLAQSLTLDVKSCANWQP